jgi:hypothetical protein
VKLIALLLALLTGQSTYPAPGPGRQANSVACVAPTMTYRWTPTSGCSTTTPCATDQVSGNNASQTTSGDLPTYGATCGPNSTPCLAFNGTSDYLTIATPIPSGVTNFTMYAIFNPTTASTYNAFFAGGNNSIEFAITTTTATLSQIGATSVPGSRSFSTGTWYTEVVTYANGSTTTAFYAASGGSLTSDGGSISQAFSFSSNTPYLGAIPMYSVGFNGPIAEWGYLNSVNTTGIANWSSCHYGV